jgi:multimeric flavodoxin WrbA
VNGQALAGGDAALLSGEASLALTGGEDAEVLVSTSPPDFPLHTPTPEKRNPTMSKIVVVFHSGYGHTQRLAEAVAEGAGADLLAIDAEGNLPEAAGPPQRRRRHRDGRPTYMGTVSWQFKKFADASSKAWFTQAWKDKVFAGFTNSATMNGDKLSTLHYLFTLAMQHSGIWVGTGLMPSNSKAAQRNDVNYVGPSAARWPRPRPTPAPTKSRWRSGNRPPVRPARGRDHRTLPSLIPRRPATGNKKPPLAMPAGRLLICAVVPSAGLPCPAEPAAPGCLRRSVRACRRLALPRMARSSASPWWMRRASSAKRSPTSSDWLAALRRASTSRAAMAAGSGSAAGAEWEDVCT